MENREENKERESGKRTDGLVHIYCGDGKGKTTASVGAAVRAAGSGKKVVIKRFLKNDHSGEVEVLKQIPGITVLPCTRQFGFSWKMSSQEKEEAKVLKLPPEVREMTNWKKPGKQHGVRMQIC